MKGSFTGTTTEFLNDCDSYERCDGYYKFTKYGERSEGYSDVLIHIASDASQLKCIDCLTAHFESEFDNDANDDDISDSIDYFICENISQFVDIEWYSERGAVDTSILDIDAEEITLPNDTIAYVESQWYMYATQKGVLHLPENKKRGEVRTFEVEVNEIYSDALSGCGYDTTIHLGDEFMKRAIKAVREAVQKYQSRYDED